ncbi:forkhead box protein G1 isoform X2 [Drosophila sechellia]|uniref:GM24129 n=1 Tax=Drosophila sechellia TaxID=7238 RepID=B4HFN4_DROSE|nr:forkhead box protein G1 isoform X2 [Drosophila sechellia]EDW42269.1 GM24129 [Drosophila sechellia]
MLASVAARLALFAVISTQSLQLLQAAPFPGIENAAFTSDDLLAEESAPVASQVHVQHNRHRRHHEDGNYHGHRHHKRHWDHHFPGPDCHHPGGFGFGFEHGGPPPHGHHHRFEPHDFQSFPNAFGPPDYEEHQRPFEAPLEPFEGNKGVINELTKQPSSSSVAPPHTAPVTPSSITRTTSTTTTRTISTARSTTMAPTSSSTEEAPLAIDIRIG